MRRNPRAQVKQKVVDLIELGNKGLQMIGTEAHQENVIREDPENQNTWNTANENERPQEKGDEHHRKGAALGNRATFVVRFTQGPSDAVVNSELGVETNVGVNNGRRHASKDKDALEKNPRDLVEAFENVGYGARERNVGQVRILQ